MISLLLIFFLKTGLSLLFFPKIELLSNSVIFNIKINKVIMLLKP